MKILRLVKYLRQYKAFLRVYMKAYTTDEVRAYWKENGILFGYPSCCIDSFCSIPLAERLPIQLQASNKTGFIPCAKHAQQIVNGEITIESLITNRLHHNPFPIN